MNRSDAAKLRAQRLRDKHGPDYFRKIGAEGGKAQTDETSRRGFASSGLAREAGKKGGDATVGRYGNDWARVLMERKKERENVKSN